MKLFPSILPLLAVLASCSSATEPCVGARGCSCYPNSTCNGPLVCSSAFSCELLEDPATATPSCYGSVWSCSAVSPGSCYVQAGCNIDLGATLETYDDSCAGHARACAEFDLQDGCESQLGCSWGVKGTTSGGPTSGDSAGGDPAGDGPSSGDPVGNETVSDGVSADPVGGSSADVTSGDPTDGAVSDDGPSSDVTSGDPVGDAASGGASSDVASGDPPSAPQ
jgi:hypothetical protein